MSESEPILPQSDTHKHQFDAHYFENLFPTATKSSRDSLHTCSMAYRGSFRRIWLCLHRCWCDELQWWQRLTTDGWLLESGAMLLSTGIFTSILTLFAMYDGRHAYSWPNLISMNTMIARLSSASRVTLLYTVTNAIIQLRWLYFRERGSLFDFHRLDAASRGPWGSLQLLFHGRHIPTLMVAIVIISVLGFESFPQFFQHQERDSIGTPLQYLTWRGTHS